MVFNLVAIKSIGQLIQKVDQTKFLLILGSFFVFFGTVQAQIMPQLGARSLGMAGTGLTNQDVYAAYNNPGAFGALDQTEVGLNYENRFLVKEIATQALAAGYHTQHNGNFGLTFQQYGFSLYREMQIGLVYARQLFKNFYGGFGINMHRIQLGENYGLRNTASGSLGILYQASDDLQFGVRVQNISRTELNEYEDERLPTRFALGLSYGFSEMLTWTFEVEKPIVHPVNIKSAFEIQPHEIIYLRLGVNSYPFQSAFGFGLKINQLSFDIATMWHNTLGISPSAGLKYAFN